MEGTRHERRHHFRGKARPGRVMSLRFRPGVVVGGPPAVGGDEAWIEASTRNIGVGGAFIVTPEIPTVGAAIAIRLTLPTSDQTFSLPAVVRWAAGDGMGVQFVGVDVDVLLELNDYFATLV